MIIFRLVIIFVLDFFIIYLLFVYVVRTHTQRVLVPAR